LVGYFVCDAFLSDAGRWDVLPGEETETGREWEVGLGLRCIGRMDQVLLVGGGEGVGKFCGV
jgi:hypothetical protein